MKTILLLLIPICLFAQLNPDIEYEIDLTPYCLFLISDSTWTSIEYDSVFTKENCYLVGPMLFLSHLWNKYLEDCSGFMYVPRDTCCGKLIIDSVRVYTKMPDFEDFMNKFKDYLK